MRMFLKSIPFILAISTGLLSFNLAKYLGTGLVSDLLINISASLIAIPLIYLVYELSQSRINRSLQKELFDYAKMQVDTSILSALFQVMVLIYDIDKIDKSLKGVNNFLAADPDNLLNNLKKKKLGFQVLRNFEENETALQLILNNGYILKYLENDQTISIVKLLKSLRGLQDLITSINLYEKTHEKTEAYKVIKGTDLNDVNNVFPNRYLLMVPLTKDTYKVLSFGDFVGISDTEMLSYYMINKDLEGLFYEALLQFIKNINLWLSNTGTEFVYDSKIFRLREMHPEAWSAEFLD